jgi:hexosaminidase
MIFRKLAGLICGVCGVVLSAAVVARAQSKTPAIIPAPLSYVSTNGMLKVSDGAVIAFPEDDADAAFAADYLARIVLRTRGIKLVARPMGSTLSKNALIVFRRGTPTVAAKKDGYDLSITGKGVEITAADRGGLFYGAVTLWGMITADGAHSGAAVLAGAEIHDAPEFAWRGLMLDSSRHMQSIEFIHQLVDWMALHKLNTLHWHLTDDQGWRLEIKRYPKLTEVGAWRVLPSMAGKIDPTTRKPYLYGGFYSQEQVRALVAYAAQRNITIVPEIEMPGHASAALAAYPQFSSTSTPPTVPASGYGIHPNLYNPTEETFTFIENILTEVMQLFPSTYIHVGGDEAIKNQWKASPQIQAQMKALGIKDEDQLQSYFIKQIDTFLTAHGRRTLGWDEILQGGLAPGATVMSWRGMQGGITAAQQGHDAVLTPTRPLYFNYRQSDAADEAPGRFALNTLSDVYHFNTSPDALTVEQRGHIIGVQGSIWTEYVITEDRVQWMLFPRVAALAELGWLPPEKRNWDSFLDRLVAQERRYGVLGINFAPSAFRVRSSEQLSSGQNKISVELHNQTNFGTIRYTVDGSAVTATSPVYEKPFDLSLPSRLRAATFHDREIPKSGIDRKLDAVSVRRRFSQDLKLCVNDPSIQMEPDPPVPGRPVMLANYKNPCWIYNDADLTGIKTVAAEVTSLPYVFHDVSGTTAVVSPTKTPDGELQVHLDSCDGTVLATLPLQPAVSNRNVTWLRSSLPSTSGVHSLCFKFANPSADKLWVIHSVQLEPAAKQ